MPSKKPASKPSAKPSASPGKKPKQGGKAPAINRAGGIGHSTPSGRLAGSGE